MRKALVVTFTLFLGFATLFAQNGRLTAAEKKQQRAQEIAENYDATLELVETKRLILEANEITNRMNRRAFVNPATNFLIIKDSIAIIQLSKNDTPGFNGLGGCTLEGNLMSYEIKSDESKKQPIYIKGRIFGTALGTFDFILDMHPQRGSQVRLTSQFGHRFSMLGQVFGIDESLHHVGRRSF